MFIKKIILLSSLFTALLLAQSEIGMNLNNKDIEVDATWDTTMLIDDVQATHYKIYTSYLHIEDENLIQAGLFAENTFQGRQDIFLSFGLKGVVADNFIVLAPSIKTKFYMTSFDIPPSYFALEGSYAPSTLSFSDAKSYIDAKVEFDMEIISNVIIYGGYRYIQTEYIDDDKTFNDGLYAGMKITF